MISKIIKGINRRIYIARKCFLIKYGSTESYLCLLFRHSMGYKLNLDNPKTFCEKLQWLKLHDKHEEYSLLVDKYEAKEYVSRCIGEEYIIPTIGVWKDINDVSWDSLPCRFVIKSTGDSGGIFVCKDRAALDIQAVIKKLSISYNRNYYDVYKEYPYKDIVPRIIVEQYMEDSNQKELRDYKFFCFNGFAKFFKIDFNRFNGHRANYYDLNGNLLQYGEKNCPPNKDVDIDIPANLDEMVSLANKLAKGKTFVRVDLYNVDGKIYFGELTFFPMSGLCPLLSYEQDLEIGNMLVLPQLK